MSSGPSVSEQLYGPAREREAARRAKFLAQPVEILTVADLPDDKLAEEIASLQERIADCVRDSVSWVFQHEPGHKEPAAGRRDREASLRRRLDVLIQEQRLRVVESRLGIERP